MINFKFYGHSCFSLIANNETILVDPYFTDNPQTNIDPQTIACQYILISHAHADHISDADAIAKKTGAKVIAIPEVLALCQNAKDTQPMNLGGTISLPFGSVHMTLALHSCGVAGGIACGFMLKFNNGLIVYYSGDTSLFSDMKLIGAKGKIDYAILPIGGNFTMDSEDAAHAVNMLHAKNVIPVHYDTWPIIKQNPLGFKQITEKITDAKVHIVNPDDALTLSK